MDETKITSTNDKPWQFKPGNPGKQPGTISKLNKTVKETVLNVFNELQDGENSLLKFANKYPRDFYAIAAKLIPTDIKAEITGDVTLTAIAIQIVKPEEPKLSSQ